MIDLSKACLRKYGEKVNMAGSPLPAVWIYGAVVAEGDSHSVIYGYDNPEMSGQPKKYPVHTDTICHCLGINNILGQPLFENDICAFTAESFNVASQRSMYIEKTGYLTYDPFDGVSIVIDYYSRKLPDAGIQIVDGKLNVAVIGNKVEAWKNADSPAVKASTEKPDTELTTAPYIYEDETLAEIYTDRHFGRKMIRLLSYYFIDGENAAYPVRCFRYNSKLTAPVSAVLRYKRSFGDARDIVRAWEEETSEEYPNFVEDITLEECLNDVKDCPVIHYSDVRTTTEDGLYILTPSYTEDAPSMRAKASSHT